MILIYRKNIEEELKILEFKSNNKLFKNCRNAEPLFTELILCSDQNQIIQHDITRMKVIETLWHLEYSFGC